MTKSFEILIYRVLTFNNNKIIGSDGNSLLNQKIVKVKKSSSARVNFYFLKTNFY